MRINLEKVAINTAIGEAMLNKVSKYTIILSRTPILPGTIIIANPIRNEAASVNINRGISETAIGRNATPSSQNDIPSKSQPAKMTELSAYNARGYKTSSRTYK